jgi:hypothetical protein
LRDGVGTFFLLSQEEVVKASPGHYPQPFLISVVKNWNKDRQDNLVFPKKTLKDSLTPVQDN